jgi:hypothetical protein
MFERQEPSSFTGAKRQKISKESSRSPDNATRTLPERKPATDKGKGESTVMGSTGDSVAAAPSDNPSTTEQPRRKSSIYKYCKTLLQRRRDSQQAPTESESNQENTPSPFDQAYIGQLRTVGSTQSFKKPDGPSDYWRKSLQFQHTAEHHHRSRSAPSLDSTWIMKKPPTPPTDSQEHPSEPPPTRRRRWSSKSWLPSSLWSRRLSAKSKGKQPQEAVPHRAHPLPPLFADWPMWPPPPDSLVFRRNSAEIREIEAMIAGWQKPGSSSSLCVGSPTHTSSGLVLGLVPESLPPSVHGSKGSQSDTDVSAHTQKTLDLMDDEDMPELRRFDKGW